MKKIVLLLFVTSLLGCEKDDICDANTSTTPRLVIQFYDKDNPTVLKAVTNLKVISSENSEGIIFNESGDDTTKYLANTSTVKIPLKTTGDTTTLSFIHKSTSTTESNKDVLTFNYTTKQVFVSRACGYKMLFDLKSSNGVVKTDATPTDGFWIQNISIVKYNLETENETHLKIEF